LKRFASDTFIIASAQAIGAVLMFGMQVILVRLLSKDGYGTFVLAQGFIFLFEAVFVPRSGEIALQAIGQAWYQAPGRVPFLANRLRREEVQWNIVIYLALVAVACIFTATINVNVALAISLGLAIPLQAGYGVSKAVIVVAHRIKQQSLYEIAIQAATLFSISFGVITGGLEGAAIGYIFVAAIKTIVAHVWADRLVAAHCKPDADGEEVVRRLRFRRLSAIAVWRNGCQATAQQADLLMIGSMLGNDGAAVYKAAKTIAAIPGRAVAPLWGALRPRLMKAVSEKDRGRIARLIAWPSLWILIAGVPVYFIVDAITPTAIQWIFTESYADAAKPVVILAVGTWVFVGATGWLGFLAIIFERKRATTLLFTLNASLILLFGRFLAHDAVAMATVVCVALVTTSIAAWWWFLVWCAAPIGREGS
jgi:O-antigen/teichoic acid export membrane protein